MSTRAQLQDRRAAAAAIGACLATLCAVAILNTACAQPGPVASDPGAVLPGATVWVTPALRSMVVGEEQEFTATSNERELPRMSAILWSIDDEAVGSLAVRPDGVALVTARAPGWFTVTANMGEISGSVTVQVIAP